MSSGQVPAYWPTVRPLPRRGVRRDNHSPVGTPQRLTGQAPTASRTTGTTDAVVPSVQAAVEALAAAIADVVARHLDSHTAPAVERRWLTVVEAAEYARTSRQSIYAAIRSGSLRARSTGRRLVIERDDLDAWIRGLPEAREG